MQTRRSANVLQGHNLERLWFAIFDVDYDPDVPFPPPGPPPPPLAPPAPRNATA